VNEQIRLVRQICVPPVCAEDLESADSGALRQSPLEQDELGPKLTIFRFRIHDSLGQIQHSDAEDDDETRCQG